MANKNLTGQTIADSYDQLLITADETGITGSGTSATQIMTGTGVAGAGGADTTALYLSTTRVGIGIGAPTDLLHIYRNDTDKASMIKIEQDGTGDAALQFLTTSAQAWAIGIDNESTDDFVIASSNFFSPTNPSCTCISPYASGLSWSYMFSNARL